MTAKGGDPDDDAVVRGTRDYLVRFKSLLDHGRTTAHGQQDTLKDLDEDISEPLDTEPPASEPAEPV